MGHMKFTFTLLIVLIAAGGCHGGIRILGEESPLGEYLDENGTPAGATVELVRELLARQGIDATIELLPWKRAYKIGLTKPDIALMETTRTRERESLFKWVGPILVVKRIVYGRHSVEHDLESPEDLTNTRNICVLGGSSNESYLYSLGLHNIVAVTKPAQCI